MEQGTCFSNGGIAIVGAMLAAVVGGLGILFRELVRVQAERILYLETQLARTLDVTEGQNEIAKDLVQKTRPRRL